MILKLLLVWLINAVALIAVAYLMPSVTVSSFGAALAVLHLLYCEDALGKRPLRGQSHLTLVYQRRGAEWVVVQGRQSTIS